MDAGDLTIEEAAARAATSIDRPLDVDDERALQRLVLAYGVCVDFALVDEVVGYFTPDAVWDGREFRFPLCRGREEIRAQFEKECVPGMRQVHVMEPPLLWRDDDPDVAHGFVHFNALRSADGSGLVAAQHTYGIYTDRYRRGRDGWKIEHRTLRLRLVRK